MKKELFQTIEIPEDVEVFIEGGVLKVKGPNGEVEREFNLGVIDLEKKEKNIVIGMKKATKKEKKIINTITAHIKNMVNGAKENFIYKLKICSSHFPMAVEKKGDKIIVKNFLGEKIPRESNILKDVNVDIKGDIITITSPNKESAGQTAANIESSTKVKNRDLRIFQDGIFIIEKCGREM